jgi:hypothetical protein
MDTILILMIILGFGLVFSSLAMGAQYIKKWRAESRRLNRRIRDLK